MKKVFFIGFILTAVLFFSCEETGTNTEAERFIINVDSISVHSPAPFDDTLYISFYGTIGTNGCYSFGYFEKHSSANQLTIIPWGSYNPADVCTDVIVMLDGRKAEHFTEFRGQLKIIVEQPDSDIVKYVLIE